MSAAEFNARIERLMREAQAVTPATARRVLGILEDARKEVVGRIAAAPSTASASQLGQLQAAIDRTMREFAKLAAPEVQSGQAALFDFGRRLADEPLIAVNIQPPLVGLSRGVLVQAQGYSAELISGLASSARRKVNQALQRAVLGGQPISALIDQVGRALGADAQPSIFRGVGARALAITRTEVPRMLSAGTHARLEQMAGRAPGRIGKEWRHNPEPHPRVEHLALDGKVIAVDEEFRVPGSGERLRFPRDPRGSAAETVNCSCSLLPAIRAAA